jgi:hypothetical protein
MNPPSIGQGTYLDVFAAPVLTELNALIAQLQIGQEINISNGSFENGSGANVAPQNWILALASGNSCNIETIAANVQDGAQSFSMTTPGSVSGGVSLTTSDYYAIGELQKLTFSWWMQSTIATIGNSVYVQFFDNTQTLISTSTLYNNSTTNDTAWAWKTVNFTAPTGARFFKLQLVGVNNATAGTVYWDGIDVIFQNQPATSFSGSQQVSMFTASGTYTPRSQFVRCLVLGGGGGGSAVDSLGNGAVGSPSYVLSSSFLARGGNGGVGSGGQGIGGAKVAPITSYTGGAFGLQCGNMAGISGNSSGAAGAGGGDYWGSSGGTAGNSSSHNGGTPAANSGGGGGGAWFTSVNWGGGGGASGEYAEWVILVTPGVAFPVVVGAGGAGATGLSSTAGSGASGLVIIID